MPKRFLYLISLFLGAILTLGYAPFSHWYIVFPSFIAFLYLLESQETSAFKIAWFFGLGWFGAGISWVHVSISTFGGIPLVASVGMMLLLCGYLALFPALCLSLLKRYIPLQLWPLMLPAMWFIAEWLRSWLLSGFPWLSIGYSQISSPLAGFIPLVGETGLSMLIVSLCAAALLALKRNRFVIPGAYIAVSFVVGFIIQQVNWVKPTEEKTRISMVQGNIEQALRWVPEQDFPTMNKYLSLTEPYWSSDVIIWPEAAIPRLEPLAQDYITQLDEQAFGTDTGLVTGIVNYNFETKEAFNNLIVVGKKAPESTEGHYQYFHDNRFAKHHLLPIGEFIPLESWLRGLAPIFDLPMSSFARGDFQQKNLLVNGRTMAPAICFEIAFPRQVAANLNSETDFIITVSNDAWFGASHGPDQHLEIAQMRAKEFGIPVLRATNNGITAFIDQKGNITQRAPQFEDSVISETVTSYSGITPYRYFGDFPLWIYTFATLLFLIIRKLPNRSLENQTNVN